MRQEFKRFGKLDSFEQSNNYSRHEMVFDENSIYTSTTTDTMPQLSTINTPLLLHYHTANAIKAMAEATANLLCFSIHISFIQNQFKFFINWVCFKYYI